MRFLVEYLIVTLSFWIVSTRMAGIVMQNNRTVFPAAMIYIISYAIFKVAFTIMLAVLSLGLMMGIGLISTVIAALAAMSVVTSLLDDYKIDSFGTLAAAVLVISVLTYVFKLILL